MSRFRCNHWGVRLLDPLIQDGRVRPPTRSKEKPIFMLYRSFFSLLFVSALFAALSFGCKAPARNGTGSGGSGTGNGGSGFGTGGNVNATGGSTGSGGGEIILTGAGGSGAGGSSGAGGGGGSTDGGGTGTGGTGTGG